MTRRGWIAFGAFLLYGFAGVMAWQAARPDDALAAIVGGVALVSAARALLDLVERSLR